jgi:copper transport protein
MRILLALLCLLAGCCLVGTVASAHASLLAADPADGATTTAAPSTFALEFNEPVAPAVLRLLAPDGRAFPLKYRLEETRVVMPAPSGLGSGTYALSWRVISADGHPVGGTTTFSIGAPSRDGPPVDREVVDWPVRIGVWGARVLTYLGLFVGIGGIFFCRWTSHSEAGLRASRIAAIFGLAALPVSVGFQGLDILDRPVTSFSSLDVWREGLVSTFGLSVGIVLLGLVLALLASARLGAQRMLALGAFLCVGLSLAATGHASTADPQWLMRPAVFVHTSVVAFWAGALLPLAALLVRSPEAATTPLRRFSASIPPLLGLLLMAGVALAAMQLSSSDRLLVTSYGRVLLAKLALVAVLLGLAAINRWGLTDLVTAGVGEARHRLVRAIGVEIGLIVCILGVAALWRFTPPPRALLEVAAQPAHVHIHSGEGMADVTVVPGRVGPVKVAIHVADAEMEPFIAKGVTVDFANKAKGIEPIEREAKLGADGGWHIDDLVPPVAGSWQVEIDILVSDFKEVDLGEQLEIRP